MGAACLEGITGGRLEGITGGQEKKNELKRGYSGVVKCRVEQFRSESFAARRESSVANCGDTRDVRRSRSGSFEPPEFAVDIQTLMLHLDPRRPFKNYYRTDSYQPLGKGGFGEVFKTVQKETGVECAVKLIQKENLTSDADMIMNELQSLLQLDHPNVLKLNEFFEDDQALYLVTELAGGGDLHDVAPSDIRRVFRQLMEGIAYCHDRGVVHRDLKTENCLLTGSREDLTSVKNVKVIDFGLSALKKPKETRGSFLNQVIGTPYFMSPEIIDTSISDYGSKCDIWSAGVVLFVLLTSVHPFMVEGGLDDNFNIELFRRILHDPYRQTPLQDAGVSADACDLLSLMLVKKAEDRLDALQVLQHSWLALDHGSVIESQNLANYHLKRVNNMGQLTRFQQALLVFSARQAQEDELDELQKAFKSVDSNDDGTLSLDEMKDGFVKCGLNLTEEEIIDLHSALDTTGTGYVDYTEWLAATLRPDVIASEKAIKAAFQFFDTDGSGQIERDELVAVLGEETTHRVLENYDAGKIGREEFAEVMRRLASDREGCEPKRRLSSVEELEDVLSPSSRQASVSKQETSRCAALRMTQMIRVTSMASIRDDHPRSPSSEQPLCRVMSCPPPGRPQ